MKNSINSQVRALTILFVLCAALSFSYGCSKDDPEEDTINNGGSGTPNEVLMQGNSFSPASITVQAGTRVTWRNRDSMAHTVTSDSGLFDSSNIAGGGSYSYTFTTPGVYSYFCKLHTGMSGIVTVN